MTLTAGKTKAMKNLMSEDGIIAALAIDQRGALKKMMKALDFEPKAGDIERF
ncbi:tagatose-bisphosphate aldolase, partial [Enterococcus cecorum]